MADDYGLIKVSNKVIKSKNVLYKSTKIMMSVLNGLYTSLFFQSANIQRKCLSINHASIKCRGKEYRV